MLSNVFHGPWCPWWLPHKMFDHSWTGLCSCRIIFPVKLAHTGLKFCIRKSSIAATFSRICLVLVASPCPSLNSNSELIEKDFWDLNNVHIWQIHIPYSAKLETSYICSKSHIWHVSFFKLMFWTADSLGTRNTMLAQFIWKWKKC